MEQAINTILAETATRHIVGMDVIDRDWLQQRLKGERGQQAALARAMGINDDKMSKIMRGDRRVQPEEIPRVMAFFGETNEGVAPELAEAWRQLNLEERAFLLSVARTQLESKDQTPEKEEPNTQ